MTSTDSFAATFAAFSQLMTIVAGIYKSAYDAFGQVGVKDPMRTSHALQVTLHVLDYMLKAQENTPAPTEVDMLKILAKAGEKGQ